MPSLPPPWDDYLRRIERAASAQELDALDHELFGRKAGALTVALGTLSALNVDEKKVQGPLLNTAKMELTNALSSRRKNLSQTLWQALETEDTLDVSLDLPEKEHGHLHPIHEFMEQIEEVFGRMGFDTAYGPEIETEENQFDLLNFPKDHAARDSQDIFYLKRQSQKENPLLLRGHTSTVQIRYMQTHKPPFRMICPGKVYRKDSDATHSPMFHQFEGVMIGKDVSLANMKAVMEAAVRELIDEKAEFRWRTGYFPFVEPGLEMDMRWRGDESQSREGTWLEICGCGMVHPNVLKNCGIDPNKWQGFAFGFGIERMLMIKHQIPDLRSFYQGDLRFLKQF